MIKGLCGVCVVLVACAVEAAGEGLRFLESAEDSLVGWETSSVPLGNGWFGANVFGIVDTDQEIAGRTLTGTYDERQKSEIHRLIDALDANGWFMA